MKVLPWKMFDYNILLQGFWEIIFENKPGNGYL